MANIKAHKHVFGLHPKFPTMMACEICGYSAPAIVLKSRVNLDAMTARANCKPEVLDLLGIDRNGDKVAEGEQK